MAILKLTFMHQIYLVEFSHTYLFTKEIFRFQRPSTRTPAKSSILGT